MLRLRAVRKTYHREGETITALDGVDLDLAPGELTVLVGPSGSGKSTLMFVAGGWEQPDSGSVSAGGVLPDHPVQTMTWDQVAFVPQAIGLLDELTVRDNVEMAARFLGLDDGRRVDELLVLLHLDRLAARRPPEVSRGEQQRAAVARALLLRPPLLLADEPTAHQDHERGALVLDALRTATDAGAACLVTSHDPASLAYADRVIRMSDGTVAEDDRGASV